MKNSMIVRFLVFTLGLLGAISSVAQTGSVSGTVVGQRQNQGQHELLLWAPGVDDSAIGSSAVTRVRIDLPKKAAKAASAGELPEGWSMAKEGGSLIFRGPALASKDLALRVTLDQPLNKSAVEVEVEVGNGEEVNKGEVSVKTYPDLAAPEDPTEWVHLPPVVSPDGPIGFTAEPPSGKELPPGNWTIGDDLAEADLEAGGWKYSVGLNYKWEPGFGLDIEYTDAWGESLAYGELDDVTAVASLDLNEVPQITDCSPKTLSGGIICVCGNFPTWESRTQLTINGKPLGYPLSSSRWVLTFRLPEVPPGEFVVAGPESAGYPSGSSATGVHIKVNGSINQENLLKGESTPLRLWLEGTNEPMQLRLWNESAGISLDGGEDQVVTTSGGTPNEVVRIVHAQSPGEFVIQYEITEGGCPCAEVIATQALENLQGGSEAVVSDSGLSNTTSSSSCTEVSVDCEKLKRIAEQAGRKAWSLRAELDRLKADQSWTDWEQDWIRESNERADAYTQKRREQAAAWRELAQASRDSAKVNRRRAKDLPGWGWEKDAEYDEAEVIRREAYAQAIEDEIGVVEEEIEGREDRSEEIDEQLQDAQTAADNAEVEAEKARAAYDACVEQARGTCPEVIKGEILYAGPVSVSDGDGEDPRDVDPGNPEHKVCGPDVTAPLLKVLDGMVRDFDAADSDTQAKACENLVTLERDPDGNMIAEYAWDIFGLDPGISGEWYQGISDLCAHPEPPCAPTVEFLGECIHSQVLNYIQWGAMNALCDHQTSADFMHWARATAGGLSDFEWKAAHYDTQLEMVKAGQSYVDLLRSQAADGDHAVDPGYYTTDKLKEMRQDVLGDLLGDSIGDSDTWGTRAAAQCATICRLTSEQAAEVDDMLWGFRWVGLSRESPEHSGRTPNVRKDSDNVSNPLDR